MLSCTDPDARMAPTRGQTAAAGAFDAQSAVERLEAEMIEIRGDIAELKQCSAGIQEIQQKMVTADALDAMMQKYLSIPPASTVTMGQDTEGTSHAQFHKSAISHAMVPTVTSAIPVPIMSSGATTVHSQGHIPMGTSTILTDSTKCTTTRQNIPASSYYATHSTSLNIPQHFQIPTIHHPPPYTFEQQPMPPHPGIWPPNTSAPPSQMSPSNFNTVIGQYLPIPNTTQNNNQKSRLQ